MGEEAMRKLRDEVAMRVLEVMIQAAAISPTEFTPKSMCEHAFRLAETFIAVRYDVDMGKLKFDKPSED